MGDGFGLALAAKVALLQRFSDWRCERPSVGEQRLSDLECPVPFEANTDRRHHIPKRRGSESALFGLEADPE